MNQAKNIFKITGMLKSKDFNEITTRNNRDALVGHLVIEVKAQGKTHNHRVEFFATKLTKDGNPNKLYDSYNTIKNDYKDKDTYSADEADVITVNGSIEYNVYKDRTGSIHELPRLRARFANRVDDKETPQSAKANVELIVDGYEQIIKNDKPTGDVKVKAYTVGYNDRGIKLVGTKVAENLGMQNYISAGTTIDATLLINNYVVTKKKESNDNVLFGQVDTVVESNSFEHSLEIVGAKQSDNIYTVQDLESIKDNIKEQINEIESRETNSGNSSNGQETTGISKDLINNNLPF